MTFTPSISMFMYSEKIVPATRFDESCLTCFLILNVKIVCRYLFDEDKIQAAELEKISKKEIINWCRRYLGMRSKLRRCLCIHIIGHNAQEGIVSDKVGQNSNEVIESPRRSMEISDLEAFKKGRECYPALFWQVINFTLKCFLLIKLDAKQLQCMMEVTVK